MYRTKFWKAMSTFLPIRFFNLVIYKKKLHDELFMHLKKKNKSPESKESGSFLN